jgi:hypothetical protein
MLPTAFSHEVPSFEFDAPSRTNFVAQAELESNKQSIAATPTICRIFILLFDGSILVVEG